MRGVRFIENLDRFDDLENHRPRRPRIIRARTNYFDELDDIDFFRRFRMTKPTVMRVLELIENVLEFESNRNQSLSPINQLLLALRFYATGSFLLTMGDFSGVSVSTSCRVVNRVSSAVANLRGQFIKLPTTQREMAESKRSFFDIAGFPNVLGAIDCIHVKIQSPGGDDAEIFRNRKGYFSINVQTVSAADLKIVNIVARWPGSTHDATIFQNSALCYEFEQNRYGNGLVLGDNGYRLREYFLTPFLNPQTRGENNYNRAHITTRNTVERQYGVLKRRFPVLSLGLRLKLERSINVIIACAVLLNICIEEKEDVPPNDIVNIEDLIEEGQINVPPNNEIYNDLNRNIIVQNFFNN